MKKLFSILAIAVILLAGVSCKKESKKEKTPPVIGEWKLEQIVSKSVQYAGQEIDIYVSFAKDGSFELYQMVGQGRFRKFTGTWKLSGSTLSGAYSSGKSWGSDYRIAAEGETLSLTAAVGGDESIYIKTIIPESIKNEAHEE